MYQALDRKLDRRVAIKRLHPRVAEEQDFRRRMEREAVISLKFTASRPAGSGSLTTTKCECWGTTTRRVTTTSPLGSSRGSPRAVTRPTSRTELT